MCWEIVFICVVLLGALISFIAEKVPVDMTAFCAFSIVMLVSMVSGSTQLPSVNQMLTVFSSPAPITIAGMFVISSALTHCGLIDRFAAEMGKLTRFGYGPFLVILILGVAFCSAFINNTAVVVVLLPVVLNLSKNLKLPASKLLIPLSYASIFGGCCTAIGTSTNILVSSLLEERGMEPLSVFELSSIGVPLLFISLIYLVLFAKKLLPSRETLSSILSPEERQKYITEAYISKDSTLVGKTLAESGLLKSKDLQLLEVVRKGISMNIRDHGLVLQGSDRLVLSCHPKGFMKVQSEGLHIEGLQECFDIKEISTHQGSIVEGILGPSSSLIGRNLSDISFRQRYRIVLLAIHRKGENMRDQSADYQLNHGDTLLMMGSDEAIEHLRSSVDIELLDRPAVPTANMSVKAPIVLSVLAGIILLASFRIMPIVGAVIVGVAILLGTGCVKSKDGYQAIEWRILILIYSMLGLGMAMESSGFASYVAGYFASLSLYLPEDIRPVVMLACMYLVTGILTETLSNNATVVLMTPIALSLAVTLGVDPRPFIIATCIASSASFSTPIGYQTNTYVYTVGGYRFSDFYKIGLPLNLLYFGLSVYLIPKIWSF